MITSKYVFIVSVIAAFLVGINIGYYWIPAPEPAPMDINVKVDSADKAFWEEQEKYVKGYDKWLEKFMQEQEQENKELIEKILKEGYELCLKQQKQYPKEDIECKRS